MANRQTNLVISRKKLSQHLKTIEQYPNADETK